VTGDLLGGGVVVEGKQRRSFVLRNTGEINLVVAQFAHMADVAVLNGGRGKARTGRRRVFTCPTNSYTSWSIWEKSNGGGITCAHAVPVEPTTGNIARSKRQRCIRLERMGNLL